jgi:hypothetical protein
MVSAVCQVVFDVDVGNRVEALHPEGALSKEELGDVAFHSFPVRQPWAKPALRQLLALTSEQYSASRASRIPCQWSCGPSPASGTAPSFSE